MGAYDEVSEISTFDLKEETVILYRH